MDKGGRSQAELPLPGILPSFDAWVRVRRRRGPAAASAWLRASRQSSIRRPDWTRRERTSPCRLDACLAMTKGAPTHDCCLLPSSSDASVRMVLGASHRPKAAPGSSFVASQVRQPRHDASSASCDRSAAERIPRPHYLGSAAAGSVQTKTPTPTRTAGPVTRSCSPCPDFDTAPRSADEGRREPAT